MASYLTQVIVENRAATPIALGLQELADSDAAELGIELQYGLNLRLVGIEQAGLRRPMVCREELARRGTRDGGAMQSQLASEVSISPCN
jgi:hypothetical protein